jgi:hypothetical protein
MILIVVYRLFPVLVFISLDPAPGDEINYPDADYYFPAEEGKRSPTIPVFY